MRAVNIEAYLNAPNQEKLPGLGVLIKKIGLEASANEFYEYYKCILHGYEGVQVVNKIKFSEIKFELGNSFFQVHRIEDEDLISYSYFYCADGMYYEGDIYHDLDNVKDVRAWFLSIIKEYLNEYYKENQ